MQEKPNVQIVLVSPEIPQNTGSTARLCAATYTKLHLIEPLGFSLEDKYLKRAGLDYWPEVNLEIHKSWQDFLEKEKPRTDQLFFFSTKAKKKYHEIDYPDDAYLIFGCETKGLAQEFHEKYEAQRAIIPMSNPNVRSINLATSIGIVLFEVRRQLGVL